MLLFYFVAKMIIINIPHCRKFLPFKKKVVYAVITCHYGLKVENFRNRGTALNYKISNEVTILARCYC